MKKEKSDNAVYVLPIWKLWSMNAYNTSEPTGDVEIKDSMDGTTIECRSREDYKLVTSTLKDNSFRCGTALVIMEKVTGHQTDRLFTLYGEESTLIFDREESMRKVMESEEEKIRKEKLDKQEKEEEKRRELLEKQDMFLEIKPKPQTGKKKSRIVTAVLEPNAAAFFRGEMSRIQNIILHKTIMHFQPYIKEAISNEKAGISKIVGPKNLDIQIPFNEIVDSSNQYDKLRHEVEDLMNIKLEFDVTDGQNRERQIINLFEKSTIPLTSHKSYVQFKTTESITRILCNPFLPKEHYTNQISRGYSTYMSNVLEYANQNTQRIYLWLSAFRNSENGKVIFPVEQIRKWLCLENKYQKWGDFKKRILENTKQELDENAYRFDLTFTYLPLYRGDSLRGMPDDIEFTIIDNRQREEFINYRTKAEKIRTTMLSLGMSQNTADNLLKLANINNVDGLVETVERIATLRNSVNNPASFANKKITEYLKNHG